MDNFKVETIVNGSTIVHDETIEIDLLVRSEDIESEPNQIAGHRGFQHCTKTDRLFKPIDPNDVRGLREYNFYRMIERTSRQDANVPINIINGSDYIHGHEDDCEDKTRLFSKYSTLKNGHDTQQCQCPMKSSTIRALVGLIPTFYGVAALINEKGTKEKPQIFICLQDLASHCKTPCIIDVKIGRKTYDGWASPEKIASETTKYAKMEEFGFRILGMKIAQPGGKITSQRGKGFGKNLMTSESISHAFCEYLSPLEKRSATRSAIIDRICHRIGRIEQWFQEHNIAQLQFISSSILIVYDSSAEPDLEDSVRVAMIDFAHVFHNHVTGCGESKLDENYVYGLAKLKKIFHNLKC